MLDCKGLLQALSAYLDGEADEELTLEIEEHLRYCVKAQTMLRTFERTIVLHRVVHQRALPDDVRIRLHEALRRCVEGEE
jgi:predicted anti-sigma-YlaC factor YlaD